MSAQPTLFDEAEVSRAACAPAPAGPAKPVFNPLTYDGGRCETCEVREQRWYLSCVDRNGNHLPNRFVCADCLPGAEVAARAAGRFELFELGPLEIAG